MPHLKYAWLQEALSHLIRRTMEAGLYPASRHLNAALAQIRLADTAHNARSDSMQIATVRLALEECRTMLTELGELQAAEAVTRAMRHLPETSYGASALTLRRNPGGGRLH